jgi:ankyrin repeat protein
VIYGSLKFFVGQGVDVNAVDGDGDTPLICAALNNHIEIHDYLVANGANSNIVNKKGQTAEALLSSQLAQLYLN